MATQKYLDRDTVAKTDVTKLKETLAPGHPAELQPKPGAENRTPSPTRSIGEQAIMREEAWGGASTLEPGQNNPGRNRYSGGVVLAPGFKADGANIFGEAVFGPAGPDPILRNMAMGTKRAIDQNDDWQVRHDYDDGAQKVGSAHGHVKRGANSGSPGTTAVPAKCGFVEAGPIRQPGK